MNEIDAKPGYYAQWLCIPNSHTLQIGKLGTFEFPAGDYLYVGSALGPGGLAARIARHLRPPDEKRLHWHIDWLLEAAEPTGVFWTYATDIRECEWAGDLERFGIRSPGGFGASDCGCKGHLLRLSSSVTFHEVLLAIKESTDDDVHGLRFDTLHA